MGLLVIVPHRRPSTADQLRNLHRQIPRLRIVCCRPATVQSSPVTSRWASPDVVRVFYSGSSGTVLGNVSSRRPSGRRRVDAARRLPTKLGAGQPVRSADAWSRRLPRQCLHSEDRPKVVNVRSSNLSTRSSRCRGGRENVEATVSRRKVRRCSRSFPGRQPVMSRLAGSSRGIFTQRKHAAEDARGKRPHGILARVSGMCRCRKSADRSWSVFRNTSTTR